MSSQKKTKINKLMQRWPKNTVAVYPWLKKFGIYRQLAEKYVESGWIERVGRGAFKKEGDRLNWFGGIYTLQTHLDMTVHPAGKTALQLQGKAHYLPANFKQLKVEFFGGQNEKLPVWFKDYEWEIEIRYVMTGLFGKEKKLGLSEYDTGNFEIKISSPERAILELCYDVPGQETFDELDKIMESLVTLRPSLVQELLENCSSVKSKRLFMYYAEKNEHPWVEKIDLTRVDLGKGKRSLCKNGRYNRKYKIVVPE